MITHIINNVRARRLSFAIRHLSLSLTLIGLNACSDWRDGIVEEPATSSQEEIAFTGSVISSQPATRADASLVNRKEYHLKPTADNGLYAGIFGAYTGQKTWVEYKAANSKKEPPANLFFNQQATVGEYANGGNPLTYTPLRFWPNNNVEGAAMPSQKEYCSLWAYYPYNPTGDPGTNGIAILPADNGSYGIEQGMGKLKFTMQPDAANQVDLLLSDLMADCSKTAYPLIAGEDAQTWRPKPVPFTFHHALAQVRIYAFIRCTDKIVYAKEGETELWVKEVTETTVTLTDGTTDHVVAVETANQKYTDAWGKEQTVTVEDGKKLRIPDDTDWLGTYKTNYTQRWSRTTDLDRGDKKYFADKTMAVAFNNLHTSAIFTPTYDTSTSETKLTSVAQGAATGTSTVNNYAFRHDWFLYDGSSDLRVMIDDEHMYGNDASGDPYFAPGNIMLVVPQVLNDDDVPNISVTVNGKDASDSSKSLSARVTVNMLKMDIKWESGFIYCYAIIDDLQPGDDKVRGPESITVIFDPTKHTDQW